MPVPYKGYDIPELTDGANIVSAFKDFIDDLVVTGVGVAMPVGSVVPFVGDAAPDNTWKVCDGSELDVTAFGELYAVIGNKFGSAGAGRFKLPDMRGAYARGAGVNGGAGAWNGGSLGASAGSLTVSLVPGNLPHHQHRAVSSGTVTVDSHSMSHTHDEAEANLPQSALAHTHGSGFRSASNFDRSGTGTGTVPDGTVSAQERTSTSSALATAWTHKHAIQPTDTTHAHTGTIDVTTVVDEGGKATVDPVTVTPPYVAFTFIIKAKP